MNALIQTLRPAYFESVERQLRRAFYEILYAPLLAIIEKANAQPTQIFNAAESALTEALQSGRVQYSNGIFSGEFNAIISKALRRLGATFDARSKVYRLSPMRVPPWIVSEATAYAMKAKNTHDELLRILNETVSHLESLVRDHPVNPEKSIDAIEHGFKPAAKQLAISPKLSEQAKAELKREYTKNMEIWVDKFSREEIVALRQRIEINATQGYRFDRLIASIKNRYSVSENKAKFLARQETSLFLANFRKQRFLDAGVRRYRWSDAHDERVRKTPNGGHKALNGKIFYYDQKAPAMYFSCGRPCNPGEDYECRCVDIPVLEGLSR